MTELITPSRRSFLGGVSALVIAAPAIVQFKNIMPVKVIEPMKVIGPATMDWWTYDVKLSRATMRDLYAADDDHQIIEAMGMQGHVTYRSAAPIMEGGIHHVLEISTVKPPIVGPGELLTVNGALYRVDSIMERPMPREIWESVHGPIIAKR